MSVYLSVKSCDDSIKTSFEKHINNELSLLSYSVKYNYPKFGIEIIAENISQGFISSQQIKDGINKIYKSVGEEIILNGDIILSIIFNVYYYLWDYIQSEKSSDKIEDFKVNMFHLSKDLESGGKYSTGFNGVYKHNVLHHISIVPKEDVAKVSNIIAADFNDMVKTWNNQMSMFHKD